MRKDYDKLTAIGFVDRYDLKTENFTRIPKPYLYTGIKRFSYFLDETVNDWHCKSKPYQDDIKSHPGNIYYSSLAFVELQDYLLKCIFSYSFFFQTLKKLYEQFYNDLLREINYPVNLNIKKKKSRKIATI